MAPASGDAGGGGKSKDPSFPFSIKERHLAPRRPAWLNVIGILLFLGLPIAAALSGALGGGPDTITRAQTPAASIAIEAPGVLRSGNWFEVEIAIVPTQDVSDLTVSIGAQLWEGLSIDTLVPDAQSARSVSGQFIYGFGAIKSGERFVLKLNGQIQPRGLRKLAGTVEARDGERLLVASPLSITVLP